MAKKRFAEWSEEDQRSLERRLWPKGPWSAEADVESWKVHGYKTQAARMRTGQLCGYLLLPKGHPWHGVKVGQMRLSFVKIHHGGISLAGPSAVDDGWVVGFECARAGDLVPGFLAWNLASTGTYRDMQYVRFSLEDLAVKAKRAARTAVAAAARKKKQEKNDHLN